MIEHVMRTEAGDLVIVTSPITAQGRITTTINFGTFTQTTVTEPIHLMAMGMSLKSAAADAREALMPRKVGKERFTAWVLRKLGKG